MVANEYDLVLKSSVILTPEGRVNGQIAVKDERIVAILGADGERMSKSRGNVQDPDELVNRYGADSVRLFLMFLGPWDQGGPWNSRGISGPQRFLDRAFAVVTETAGNATEARDDEATRALRRVTHQTMNSTAGSSMATRSSLVITASLLSVLAAFTAFRYCKAPE